MRYTSAISSSSAGPESSARPARVSAAASGFRQGAGLWFGFVVCAIGTMFCMVLVVTLLVIAVGAIRGSKGFPGSKTLSAVLKQGLARGGNDGGVMYVQPAMGPRMGIGRYEFAGGSYRAAWRSSRGVGASLDGRGNAEAGGPPVVSARWPGEGASGVAVNSPVQVRFGGPMNRGSMTEGTLVVHDPVGKQVPARVSYNAASGTATIDPRAPLGYSTKYVVTVRGGAAGVKEWGGAVMAGDVTWSFQTVDPPQSGPGGPILVVTNPGNRFSGYYAEILRAEGLNEFATADIGAVNASMLAGHRIAILGQTALTGQQAAMFAEWVEGGGCLIAMRPDKQLAGVLGLNPTPGTVDEGYLRVATESGPGAGITAESMQFHGTADVYDLEGATAVASLQGEGNGGAKGPAVTIRAVGTRGGQAAAFTYDLAKSVVYTRQGNPAWAGRERDGWKPVRSNDMFYGNAADDRQPDWVDPDKVTIPQADEQQRLLANMVVRMALPRVPLPRFWYLPQGHKATVVMTGDDHSHGGTAGRFDAYIESGAPNASVDDWRAVRGTSYMYPTEALTDSQAAEYVAAGFELGLHVTTYEADWTPKSLEEYFGRQLEEFEASYPSVPAPLTERTHAIVWSDYVTHAQVEFRHRIRLDTNYYYFPGKWVRDRPGLFTGSGFPMRFATAEGETVDVYQAATQMTDESGQSYPHHADVLLDNALGPAGYYGAFTANMHTDVPDSPGSDAIVAAAQARGVPVVSAVQMLRWLDGRNGSSFAAVRWDDETRSLRFAVKTAPGANGLQGMVPLTGPGGGTLTSIRRDGAGLRYAVETIKGVTYAFFPAGAGEYVAAYAGGAGDRPAVAAGVGR